MNEKLKLTVRNKTKLFNKPTTQKTGLSYLSSTISPS